MSAKKFQKYNREQRASLFDYIAAAIEDDPEWFVDDGIDDAVIADGLRIAAKAIRDGKQ